MERKHHHYQSGYVYKRDGKLIYITGGSYEGSYGRISNHFSWKRVKKDGSLGKESSGYGQSDIAPVKCTVKIKVILDKDKE